MYVLSLQTTPLTSLQESLVTNCRRRWTHEQIRCIQSSIFHCSDSFRLDVKGKPPAAVSENYLGLRIFEQIRQYVLLCIVSESDNSVSTLVSAH